MATTASGGWWRLSLALPPELEESLLWRLPLLGVPRVAICHPPEAPGETELVAWLPEADWPEAERQALEEALRPLAEPFSLVFPPLRWQRQEEEDWSRSWKRHWGPDPIGQTLLVLPAWLDVPAEAEGRRVIRLDPGPAFGTGSHPTTRLCLEGMETLAAARVRAGAAGETAPLAGWRVADLGCGSGLLGLAALALGAEAVLAVDTDALAIRATRENAALNGFNGLTAALGSADTLAELLAEQPADLLLCNILAPVIAALSGQFRRLLVPGGQGLLSGLLLSQADDLIRLLEEEGWEASLGASNDPWALLDLRERQDVA
ncbi:MAG: 50S ribosomal protein L11 methyltransferase [Cyanobacteriota bacterium]|nr:50S ribosomal protein L11 methyltransferase [Cyanobacteriota bacterium]